MADPTNTEIALALDELGDLYELDGAIVHRIVAYRNAAKAVREASVSVLALAREGRATELPGVGAIIQEKVLALADDGAIPAAVKLRAKFPAGLIEITRLPGLGPKRARRLFEELGIDSPAALREAAEGHQIRELKGFGPKAEEALLAALQARETDGPRTRVVLDRALGVAEQLVAGLREHPAAELVEIAGSARRMTDSVKDLDIVATASRPPGAVGRGQPARHRRELEYARRGRRAPAHPFGPAGRSADRGARPVRQPAPAPHRLEGPQHGAARRRRAQGAARLRVRRARRRHRRDPPMRDRGGGVRAAGDGLHRARAARGPRRARGRRPARAARADHRRGPPGRPALPHDRLRRDRVDRGDGARRPRRRVRVPGDHRPFGELRVRRPRRAGPAAPAGAADPRDRDRRHRAAGRQRGQHPPRRHARLRRRPAGRARLGRGQRPLVVPDARRRR